MINPKTTLIALLLFSFIFQSCSSDDSPETENKTVYIRFTIAASNYDFEDITTGGEVRLNIEGTNGLSVSEAGHAKLVLHVPADLSEGSFPIAPGDFASDGSTPLDAYKIALNEENLGFFNDFAESGTIRITEITTSFVEGTFNAKIPNGEGATALITNGSFRAVYIQ